MKISFPEGSYEAWAILGIDDGPRKIVAIDLIGKTFLVIADESYYGDNLLRLEELRCPVAKTKEEAFKLASEFISRAHADLASNKIVHLRKALFDG